MPDTPLSSPAPDPAPRRLEGWKEISAYFGRGVRTVQRWETTLGMPVHRMAMVKGETVYALVEELEVWRRSNESRAGSESVASERRATRDPGPDDGAAAAAGAVARPAGVSELRAATGHRAGWVAAIAGAMLLVAAAWASSHVDRWPWTPVSPARAQVEGNAPVAYDGAGKVLWHYAGFPFRLTPGIYESLRRDGRDPIAIDDVDGDGREEVLFAAEAEQAGGRSTFYCFDPFGNVRFTYQPKYQVTFGPLKSGPPYRLMWFRVFGESGRGHRIWLVWTHPVEFPTVVVKMDSTGRALGNYWSNGEVTLIDEATLGGRPVVIIGASNNETHGASLAILDRGNPTGTAPAEADHYRCVGCPPVPPLAFIVFPPLDVTRVIGTYASVNKDAVDADGQISVVLVHHTAPVVPDSESSEGSESLYQLDREFRVAKAELAPGYGTIHRLFEAKGFLTHTFGAAEDANLLWPVRRWNAERKRFDLVTGIETGR